MYRITAILKVETDIITFISASLIGRAEIMSVKAFRTDVITFISVSLIGRAEIMSVFRTDVIAFISDVIMCFMSD
jgi:hypothetical protein